MTFEVKLFEGRIQWYFEYWRKSYFLYVVFFLFSFLAVSLVHCYLLISNFIFVSYFIPLCYSFSLLLNNFFYSSAFKLFLAFYIFLFCLFFPLCFHCLRSHYFLLLLFPVSIHFLYVQFISLLFLPFFFFILYLCSSLMEWLMVDQSRTSQRFNEPHHFSSWFHPSYYYSRWTAERDERLTRVARLFCLLFMVVLLYGKIGFVENVSIVDRWKKLSYGARVVT